MDYCLRYRAQRRKDSFVAKQAAELRYAVRFRVVFKYFGQLCLVLAALSLVPLAVTKHGGGTPKWKAAVTVVWSTWGCRIDEQ